MSYTVFTGCSVTEGINLPYPKEDPDLWVNVLHRQNQLLSQTKLINLGLHGRSNANIFLDSINCILNHKNTKYLFVQWTNAPRYEIDLGVELYNTRVSFIHNRGNFLDIELNDITFSSKWLEKVNKTFMSLSHQHCEILAIVKYTNHLISLAKLKNIEIFFLAAPVLWDTDYFKRIDLASNFDVNRLTPNTRKFLNVNNRSDDEILKLYNKIHDEYEQAGGIQDEYWCTLGCYTDDYNPGISTLPCGHWSPSVHHDIAKICSDKINSKLLNQQ